MKNWTDERLVPECLNGNEQAWSVLIERYKRLIYSVPVRYHLSGSEAADIFQSVCLDLYSELPRLRDPGALRTWLIKVAIHQCLHWKRKHSRLEAQDAGADQPDDSMYGSPGALAEQLEREQILREAMAQIPPRCRKMIEMLFLQEEQAPYTDVARELGLAVGSIGFIRQRCLKRLRKALEERGFNR